MWSPILQFFCRPPSFPNVFVHKNHQNVSPVLKKMSAVLFLAHPYIRPLYIGSYNYRGPYNSSSQKFLVKPNFAIFDNCYAEIRQTLRKNPGVMEGTVQKCQVYALFDLHVIKFTSELKLGHDAKAAN